MTYLKKHRYSVASACTVLVVLPGWVDFCWRQRGWMPRESILVGGPMIVAFAVWLGARAWRRGEPAGGLAAATAALLPWGVFMWMNFAGNP